MPLLWYTQQLQEYINKRAPSQMNHNICSLSPWSLCVPAVLLLTLYTTIEARAAEINVSGIAGFRAALVAAKPGDILRLAPGEYGDLALNGDDTPELKFSGKVTITAKDPNRKPRFQRTALTSVSNITLSDVLIDYEYQPETEPKFRYITITNSNNVTIRDSIIDGDNTRDTQTVADGYGTGIALGVNNSSGVTIQNNKIFTWHRGAVFARSHDITVADNDFYDLRSDGIDFAGVTNVVVSGNHFHDFRRSPESKDHPDMIQFWTRGTNLQTVNVTISDNYLDAGKGDATQSIFMRNEEVDTGRAGLEMYYKNVRIEGNLIRNGHLHGITLGEVDGLTIANNTLMQNVSFKVGGKISVPLINISKRAQNVTVKNNIFPRQSQSLKVAPASWNISSNFVAQRDIPTRPDYYDNIFLNARETGEVSLSDLMLRPESEPAKAKAGSPLTAFTEKPKQAVAIIDGRKASASGDKVMLKVSGAYGPSGPIDMSKAEISWDFGDNSSATGREVEHTYAALGQYNVQVTLKIPDGSKIMGRRLAEVSTP
jgi:nitrous oxidase accessory protein NosD